jgi:hypothetical protein
MERLVYSHVTSGRRGMVSRKNVTAERARNDNQHEHFLVVLDRLENDKFAIEKR